MVGTIPGVRSLPLWGKVQMDQQKAKMFEVVDRAIEARKKEMNDGALGHHDLLDLLLNAKDPFNGSGLTAIEVRDEAMTFVLAGHDTTSNLMTWMLHVLMTRPSLWEECAAEAFAVCGDEPPRYEHLARLPVLEAVIHETLRFFPPVPIIQKVAVVSHSVFSDDPNSGRQRLDVKEGTQIHIDIHVIHRLKQYWGNNADVFDHTRWLVKAQPFNHPFAFMPFSAGVRNCIGQNFALMEAKVMMVMILRQVRMQFVAGQEVDATGAPVHSSIVTLRPKYGVNAKVTMRGS